MANDINLISKGEHGPVALEHRQGLVQEDLLELQDVLLGQGRGRINGTIKNNSLIDRNMAIVCKIFFLRGVRFRFCNQLEFSCVYACRRVEDSDLGPQTNSGRQRLYLG